MTSSLTIAVLAFLALTVVLGICLRERYGQRRVLGKYQNSILLGWLALMAVVSLVIWGRHPG